MLRGLLAGLLALGCAAGPVFAQTSVEERLARVAADLFGRGEQVDADIAELKSILAADPKSAPAHGLLGVAYLVKRSPDLVGEAAGELRQAIDLDPSLIPARLYLGHLYLDMGRPERAGEELQAALTAMPGQPQLLALLAESQRQAGKPDAALELTTQALKANPSLAEARYYQGLALYDLKRRDEAIRVFEQVLEAGERRPEVFGSLGTAYLEAGRVDEAIASLTDGVRLDPSRPDLMIPLARGYRLKGQLSRADAALATARSLAGTGAVSGAQQQLQRDLSFEEGLLQIKQVQLAAAARSLRQVVDVDPSYGPGYRYLAEVYLRQGLYTKALEQATRAEKLGAPLPADLQKTLQDKLRASTPKGRE